MFQRIFLCEHTGIRTLIISVLEFSPCVRIGPETVVRISDYGDLVDFIGADLVADFRRAWNIEIAVAFLHFSKFTDMADGAANAGMIIVDVGTGQDQLLTVKTGNDDAFPVPDSKECMVIAVDETDHTLVLIRIWKGENAHDIYRLAVCHRASPLSFFGVVRFCSCCAMRFCCFLYSSPARSQKSSTTAARQLR